MERKKKSYSIGRGKAILIMLLAIVILIISQVVALLAGGFAVGTLKMPAVAGTLISAILYILFSLFGIGFFKYCSVIDCGKYGWDSFFYCNV